MNLKSLTNWYLNNQRPLPFRQHPSPYGIWVSEVMLQQTQMETVLRYYDPFIKKFPDIKTLAQATLQEVLTQVQGLGYYRRFRLLHAGAQHILSHHQGLFPQTYEEVLSIPGVGAYTAGAIMAIAFNQPYPATDGNVIRVLSRVYDIQQDMRLPKSRAVIDKLHGQLVKKANPRDYIQAVMELGALICRPVQPNCHQCPLQSNCRAYQSGSPTRVPVISKKSKSTQKEWQTLLIIKNKQILLRKNSENLLKDFYLLPQWEDSLDVVEQWLETHGFSPLQLKTLPIVKHVFTHQVWHMQVHQLLVKSGEDLSGEWFPLQALSTIPIPEAHQKIIRTYFPQYAAIKAL